MRDVQVPYSGKGGVVGIARRRPIRCGRAVERNRRTAGVSCRGRREGDVVDPVCSTDVVHVFPRLSPILRDRHTGTGSVVRESEVDPARCIDAKRRIVARADKRWFGSVSAGVHCVNRP